MTQTSKMGATRLIILDVQDQGRNSEDFVELARSHLIVLNVQDQVQNFEDRQAHSKLFYHFQHPRSRANFWIFSSSLLKIVQDRSVLGVKVIKSTKDAG